MPGALVADAGARTGPATVMEMPIVTLSVEEWLEKQGLGQYGVGHGAVAREISEQLQSALAVHGGVFGVATPKRNLALVE